MSLSSFSSSFLIKKNVSVHEKESPNIFLILFYIEDIFFNENNNKKKKKSQYLFLD